MNLSGFLYTILGETRDTFSPRTSGIPASKLPIQHAGYGNFPLQPPQTSQGLMQQVMQGTQLGVPNQSRPSTSPGVPMKSGPLAHPSPIRQSPVPSRVASSPALDVDLNRPSRPSSRDIREVHQGMGATNPSVLDYSGRQPPPNQQGRNNIFGAMMYQGESIQHRPSSAMSEPGFVNQGPQSRSMSPVVSGNKNLQNDAKRMSCVRDLIHSAIERNLVHSDRPADRPPEKRKYFLQITAHLLYNLFICKPKSVYQHALKSCTLSIMQFTVSNKNS